MLFFRGEGGIVGLLFVQRLERFVGIARRPRFILGKRTEPVA